ncbi:MAG: aldehyde dehydrogenase family protein, partial [Spirochaetota bacterium]|nr:aldehyde dehydrogenase family protein [Spirochaetota bacterium]
MEYLGDYINNSFSVPKSPSGIFTKINPGDLDDNIGKFHYSFDNLNNTVECARKAFSSWRKLSIKDRISYVENYREVLINRKSD